MKDDCVRSCLIELKSFLLSKLFIDPIHRVLVSFPCFLFVPSIQVNLVRMLVFFVQRIHSRKEYRLSFAKFCPPGINPEFMMECKLIAHPM